MMHGKLTKYICNFYINSRNSIELTLWDALADNFEKQAIDTLERPIIIAISSCKVSKLQNRGKSSYL